jgi:hypothetical protein
LFSDGATAAGDFVAINPACTSGALRRLAREDSSELDIEGAGLSGIAGLFAMGVTGAAVV